MSTALSLMLLCLPGAAPPQPGLAVRLAPLAKAHKGKVGGQLLGAYGELTTNILQLLQARSHLIKEGIHRLTC